MEQTFQLPENKPGFLEKFGLYYLNFFSKNNVGQNAFDIGDEVLNKKVKRISFNAMLYTCIVSLACVFPTVWVDVHFADAAMLVHYGWVVVVTLVSIIIELYLLFLIALHAVHLVSELLNIKSAEKEFLKDGAFGVKNILARTALEIPDPELKILGIDPFKRISKKNLFVLSLFYKAKIFLTNFILKCLLLFLVGKTIFGMAIQYESLPVECFWNCMVIIKVIHEARLRLFGFVLAQKIAENMAKENLFSQISEPAKIGCLRAIGNAVVMTQNYHPNMVILMLEFLKLLNIKTENKYDDWNLFLSTLKTVPEKERNLLLDVFTIAAAFDGKLSKLEMDNLNAAYGNEYALYKDRLIQLTHHLKHGKLNAALALCQINFVAG